MGNVVPIISNLLAHLLSPSAHVNLLPVCETIPLWKSYQHKYGFYVSFILIFSLTLFGQDTLFNDLALLRSFLSLSVWLHYTFIREIAHLLHSTLQPGFHLYLSWYLFKWVYIRRLSLWWIFWMGFEKSLAIIHHYIPNHYPPSQCHIE